MNESVYDFKPGIDDKGGYINNAINSGYDQENSIKTTHEIISQNFQTKISELLETKKTSLDDEQIKNLNGYRNLIQIFIDFFNRNGTTQNSFYGCLFVYLSYYCHLRTSTEMVGGQVTYSGFNNNPGNTIDPSDMQRKNILIIGGGPNGLYMATIFKKMKPNFTVVVLENRVDENNERNLKRSNFINTKFILDVGMRKYWHYVVDSKEFTPFDNFVRRELYEPTNGNDLVTSKDGSINLFLSVNPNYTKNESTINEIELMLAQSAQEAGALIVHSKQPYTNYLNSNTEIVFDSTGGNFGKNSDAVHYEYYVINKKQPIGAGLNLNSYNFIEHEEKQIPFVCIGDSLFKGDFTQGYGLNTNFTLIYFIAKIFTNYVSLQDNHNSLPIDKIEIDFNKDLDDAKQKPQTNSISVKNNEICDPDSPAPGCLQRFRAFFRKTKKNPGIKSGGRNIQKKTKRFSKNKRKKYSQRVKAKKRK